MASLTSEQWIAKNNKRIQALVKFDKPLLLAVSSVMALQSKRIFLNGENKEGQPIGTYVKKAVRVSRKEYEKMNLPGIVYAGKNGDTTHTNSKSGKGGWNEGEQYKTGYFPDFLEFKKSIGRNERIGTVDLFLTGELHRHWANNNKGVGGIAEAKKINVHKYVVSISNHDADKVDRYGLKKVFGLNAVEKKAFIDVARDEFFKVMSK